MYDAVDRLHRRGLVDVQRSDPREYRAISKDKAFEVLRDDYESTLEAADKVMSGLSRSENLEESGTWAIADQDHVSNRIATLAEDAEGEVYTLVADDRTVDPEFSEPLSAACDHGIDVPAEVPSEDAKETIETSAPVANVAVTESASDPARTGSKWLGRMVTVDRSSVLPSGVSEGSLPGELEGTAIRASGQDHGLVVGTHHLLGAYRRRGRLRYRVVAIPIAVAEVKSI